MDRPENTSDPMPCARVCIPEPAFEFPELAPKLTGPTLDPGSAYEKSSIAHAIYFCAIVSK